MAYSAKNRTPEEIRAALAENTKRWREKHPERAKESKRKYYASEKGKASKRREDAAYTASGGRADAEKRRAKKGVSPARMQARYRWARKNKAYYTAAQSKRRALDRALGPNEFWMLQEAVELARLRECVVGGAWHVDHVVPVSLGGTSKPENLQVVPARWNQVKSNHHAERMFGA